MDALIDFFAVRPVFTLYGLRVLWGAYLIDQALPIVALFSKADLTVANLPAFLAIFFQACLNIGLARLLIEVAAAVLLGRPTSVH
jgi:hypothetical protein